jgi:two-component system, sensor histidine kinase and response regulator
MSQTNNFEGVGVMVKKILVIEDEDSLRQDIVELLNFEGYKAVGAENGLAGLHVAYEFFPDLIVCDITMPEMDGIAVLSRLRSNPMTTTIPFIFLTARVDRNDQRLGMNLGADDYLTKPFALEELLSSVHARLEKADIQAGMVAQRLNELRDSIILSLPHEMRTPLTVILGFSDILAQDCARMDTAAIADMAQHINEAAFRLHNLVENYLSYAQIQMINSDPQRLEALRGSSTLNPKRNVEHYALQKAASLNRRDDLVLQVQDVPSIQIIEENIRKIMIELVDNAFKFSAPDSKVFVNAFPSQEYYHIRITNQGRGMSAAQIAKIGPYMQFERWKYEQQGSGLGLAIVQRLVELHNGKLIIESKPDEFLMVEVLLPILPVLEQS